MKIPNEAITHNGRFHADDVFSAALLKILNPQIHIERKNSVPEGYPGLVFDLGDGQFDHHGARSQFRENGVQYASFGLFWKWDEETDPDECFFRAVEMAKYILENEIKNMNSTEHAEKTVRDCLDKQQAGIVMLPQGMPWKAILIPSEVLFVVYPSPRGGYNAQAIPKAIDTQECKKPFPEKWRGERDKLSELADIPGLTFCHVHGYLLGAEMREAAVEACIKAMKY